MARYKDEQCRICRREGQKLFLKGSRCYSDKCSVTRRNYAPGQHGQKRTKLSEYGTQLREKQKTKSFYGVGKPARGVEHFGVTAPACGAEWIAAARRD